MNLHPLGLSPIRMARPAPMRAAVAALALAVAAAAKDDGGAEEEPACRVIPGKKGLILQGVLMVVCLTALTVKFKLDKSGRTCFQFMIDSSKQLVGAGWTHVLNLLMAIVLKTLKLGNAGAVDECSWYWIEIVMDTTVGVWIEYHLLNLLIHLAKKYEWRFREDITAPIPDMGNGFCKTYMKQIFVWLLIVTGMKSVMVCLMLVEQKHMIFLSSIFLWPADHLEGMIPSAKLVAVMIATPAIMNSVQFWLQDSILLEATSKPVDPSELKKALLAEEGTSTPALPTSEAGAPMRGLQECGEQDWKAITTEVNDFMQTVGNNPEHVKRELRLLKAREVHERRVRAGHFQGEAGTSQPPEPSWWPWGLPGGGS